MIFKTTVRFDANESQVLAVATMPMQRLLDYPVLLYPDLLKIEKEASSDQDREPDWQRLVESGRRFGETGPHDMETLDRFENLLILLGTALTCDMDRQYDTVEMTTAIKATRALQLESLETAINMVAAARESIERSDANLVAHTSVFGRTRG